MMDDQALRDLHNVIVFAMLDGDLNDKECAFIERLASRMGMDQATLDDLCRQIRDGHKSISMPKSPADAEKAVQMLAEAAAVDGTISTPERRLLQRICRHVGLDEQHVEMLIEAVLPASDETPSVDADARQAADDERDRRLEAMSQEVYERFASWDAPARAEKLHAMAAHGAAAVIPLLRMLESYRAPDGMDDPQELKSLITEELGGLADERAIYYLAQQINIGDLDDESTSANLRGTAAAALGKIVGQPMSPDAEGIAAARKWWRDVGRLKHDRLAF
ncbi:MAG: hypothetical protein ABFD92_19465 [Planctomycetaceae bacterium]|nr:TerB family tellurite resistance protein [Planctomycetaceae bacterium]